jgi:hypothetical protein
MKKKITFIAIALGVVAVFIIAVFINFMNWASGGRGMMDELEGNWSGTIVLEDNIENAEAVIKTGDNNAMGYLDVFLIKKDKSKEELNLKCSSDKKKFYINIDEDSIEADIIEENNNLYIKGTKNNMEWELVKD